MTVTTSTPVGYGMWTVVLTRVSLAPPPPLLGGGGGVVLGAGVALVAGGGLGGQAYLLLGRGMAPFDESSDSKCHLQAYLWVVLVTWGPGGVVWPWAWVSSFIASSPSQSALTIAAPIPSFSARV